MHYQHDCVFCFDPINVDQTIFSIDDLESCNRTIVNYLNSAITLDCNHCYHVGCFANFIKTKYQSEKKRMETELEYVDFTNFCINCPYCRHTVDSYIVVSIIQHLNRIKRIKENVKDHIKQTQSKMFYSKLKMYSKKIFQFRVTPDEFYKYYKMVELCDEWKLLDAKITCLTRETDSLYRRICEDYT